MDSARKAIDYFNGFHDGFIAEIKIRSRDRMEPDKSHLTSSLFDVDIVFAHYNYDQGSPPYDRTVRARFEEVSELGLDFRGVTFDWAINDVLVEPAGDQLLLRLARNSFDAETRKWSIAHHDLFRFRRAEVWDSEE